MPLDDVMVSEGEEDLDPEKHLLHDLPSNSDDSSKDSGSRSKGNNLTYNKLH